MPKPVETASLSPFVRSILKEKYTQADLEKAWQFQSTNVRVEASEVTAKVALRQFAATLLADVPTDNFEPLMADLIHKLLKSLVEDGYDEKVVAQAKAMLAEDGHKTELCPKCDERIQADDSYLCEECR